MLAAKIEQIRDMLFPGLRAWMGKGVPVDSLDDFFIRNGDLVLRVRGGVEHIIAFAEEIENDSFADLFNPRLKALIPTERTTS